MTLRVGGIKLSPRLVQFDIARDAGPELGLAALLNDLAAAQINLPFFTRLPPGAPTLASFCVAETDHSRSEEIARGIPGMEPHLTVRCPVVAVSVYPHRAKAALLAAILQAHTGRKLPLLGMATSLSALTITLDAGHLAQALAGLDEVLELPENHAPLRWELLVKQTPP